MISQTKMIIAIIVAIVVSSAITAFALNKEQIIMWVENMQKPKPPVDPMEDTATKGSRQHSLTDILN